MSKQQDREEAERLIKEAMERKGVTIKQGDTRIEATCGKCHGNDVVVAKGKLPGGNVASKFHDSIHGKALKGAAQGSAPTCTNCHGAHSIRAKGEADHHADQDAEGDQRGEDETSHDDPPKSAPKRAESLAVAGQRRCQIHEDTTPPTGIMRTSTSPIFLS